MTRQNGKGGSASLFISDDIVFSELQELSMVQDHIQCIFIIRGHTYFIGLVYRPPNSNIAEFRNAMHSILDKIASKPCYIMGDYNLDLLQCEIHHPTENFLDITVHPKKYAHGFVVLCFVVMQSFIMNSHGVFIHIIQGGFAGTGAIVRLPQCQWSKPDGYRKISQCITTTKHSKAKTVCIFLGIYCMYANYLVPLINRPTRITWESSTLIDNIFSNNYNVIDYQVNVILKTDISDHYIIFHLLCLHVEKPTDDQYKTVQ